MDNTDPEALLAALAWQVELGVDAAVGDVPVDRYAARPPSEPITRQADAPRLDTPQQGRAPKQDDDQAQLVEQARQLAGRAATLAELRSAMAGFDGCILKQGARNLVFSDGHPAARLMIVGEAPGKDEDREGKPFVGRSGQLLDKMLAAIGRDRSDDSSNGGVYITNVLPWRPPANRDPGKDEMAMMKPFLLRHIALAAPDCLLLLGNAAMKTLYETDRGITAMRGQWREVGGIAAIASFHPAALLRNGLHKRSAWQDLQMLKSRLDTYG